MSQIAWHLYKNFTNAFNIRASVSIDTKLYTCKICGYKMEYFSGICLLVGIGRALLVRQIISPNTLICCLSHIWVWQPSGHLLYPYLVYRFLLKQCSSVRIIVGNVIFMDTNNYMMETTKLWSLQCLCEITPKNIQSGKEFHRCLLLSYTISDTIMYDIGVSCPLANQFFTMIFQFYGTLVILIDNIVTRLVSLLFREVLGTDNSGQ